MHIQTIKQQQSASNRDQLHLFRTHYPTIFSEFRISTRVKFDFKTVYFQNFVLEGQQTALHFRYSESLQINTYNSTLYPFLTPLKYRSPYNCFQGYLRISSV